MDNQEIASELVKIAKEIIAGGPQDAFKKEIQPRLEKSYDSYMVLLKKRTHEIYNDYIKSILIEINMLSEIYKDKKTDLNRKLMRYRSRKDSLEKFYKELYKLMTNWLRSKVRNKQ